MKQYKHDCLIRHDLRSRFAAVLRSVTAGRCAAGSPSRYCRMSPTGMTLAGPRKSTRGAKIKTRSCWLSGRIAKRSLAVSYRPSPIRWRPSIPRASTMTELTHFTKKTRSLLRFKPVMLTSTVPLVLFQRVRLCFLSAWSFQRVLGLNLVFQRQIEILLRGESTFDRSCVRHAPTVARHVAGLQRRES